MLNLAFALISLPGSKIVERHAWMDLTWTDISLCPAWLCYLVFWAFLLSGLLSRSVAAAGWFSALLAGFWIFGLELPTGRLLIVSALGWAFLVFRKPDGENSPTAWDRVLARGATGVALFLLAVAIAAGFPGYQSL